MKTNRVIAFVVASALVLFASISLSDAAQEGKASHDVVEGNALYESGNFEQAIHRYEAAIENGLDNADVHFNLANAFYRSKDYGKAIAHYREALQYSPLDADIKANLSLARKQVVDRIEDSASLSSQLERLLFARGWFSSYQLEVGFLIAYCLFWVGFLLEPLNVFGSGRAISGTLLAALLFTALMAFGTRLDRTGKPVLSVTPASRSLNPAVITRPEVKVYSGNSEQFQVVFVLHAGAEVDSAERRGDWIQVVLPPQIVVADAKAASDTQTGGVERRGWIKASDCYVIS